MSHQIRYEYLGHTSDHSKVIVRTHTHTHDYTTRTTKHFAALTVRSPIWR